MTKFDFIKDIDTDNPTRIFTRFLPQVSVMYYLIGGRSDVDVYAAEDPYGDVQFSVLAEQESSAKDIQKYIEGNHFRVYGVDFLLHASQHKNTVTIRMGGA